MTALLDDGQRQLVEYLERRTARARTLESRLRAWIMGVLSQVRDLEAAARSRPFVVNQYRLAQQHPDASRASVDRLVESAAAAIGGLPETLDYSVDELRRKAFMIYLLAFGAMQSHVVAATRPTAAEADHLVRFSIGGLRTP